MLIGNGFPSSWHEKHSTSEAADRWGGILVRNLGRPDMERMTRNPMITTTMMRKWMSLVFNGRSLRSLFRQVKRQEPILGRSPEKNTCFPLAFFRMLFYFNGK